VVQKQSQCQQSVARADRVRDVVSENLQTVDVREMERLVRADNEVLNNLDVKSFMLHLEPLPSALELPSPLHSRSLKMDRVSTASSRRDSRASRDAGALLHLANGPITTAAGE
jgi:hypothetical protein